MTLIRTSCKYVELVKPFCDLLVILSVVVINLLVKSREIILYKFESNEMGRQFLMSDSSPFFGISRILAVLKVSLKQPLAKQQFAYRSSGFLRVDQNLLINLPLRPSMPAADFLFDFLTASSSSNRVKPDSSFVFSANVKILSRITGWDKIDGLKKFSMQPLKSSGSSGGFV